MRKIVKMSIVAASLIATTAMAADKGIDITTTGQAVVYYQTLANNGAGSPDLFDQATGRANAGLQLNLDADLKNGFTFGSQINYLGTLGLEKNIVSNTMQNVNGGITENSISDDVYLSQLYVAKKIANTTVKLGRQELPQSLSPFAYSEGWNVFKNTFDAALVVNTDIPNTTLVGAYVGGGNYNNVGSNMSAFGDLTTTAGTVDGTAYMLTVQNKSIPMATVTGTYYSVSNVAGSVDADIFWGDVAIAGKDLPMGLNFGIQGGQISPDAAGLTDTSALGLKVGMKVDALTLMAAYTTVDDGTVGIKNTGGVKTPLYTQMILNQSSLYSDNDTYMLKAAYSLGSAGTIIAQGTMTDDNRNIAVPKDLTDLELIYKVKAGGVDFLAAYVNQSWDAAAGAADGQDLVRLVARYNF
ncbi:MAG: hypothetical protein A2513_10810 [Sulfurimonas sp. RIFOXYD12_FULL_33_39]|uniref:hypothetical protein n=1 Tax=unclassified Sulfurimonas TaxID=2623549 RepID=UPI0008D07F6F|nr:MULTISPECIES: hypothetical protein [unclassified Sulfurimonas]OHE09797.1 MAG: hypothetical protein A2513_10810 [Sulfurimonas sp. RIFOXYD12_FULL_33_39]OHE13695.1 MAG: hypothetical protein A2530_08945 [Sulfurimonas sp. RIFOXYD2_FULL_34_21]DAB28091.1 MAG TPA: hypothetical protein CFH78_04310 [Sulfurimonas sp. UBA10385]